MSSNDLSKPPGAALCDYDGIINTVPAWVDWHLKNWAEWMHADPTKLGYPTKSSGTECGGISGDDAFDHLCESADHQAAMITDGVVSNLEIDERCMIHHVYLSSVVTRRDPYKSMESAINKVYRMMIAKGLQ